MLGRELRALCRRHRILFSVAGDIRLALRLGADAVHLPEHLAHRAGAAHKFNSRWLVTVSAHDEAAIIGATKSGADAILLSPVFATAGHPEAKTLGPLRFAHLAHRTKIPVIALGGITAISAKRVPDACGLAAIGALS